MVFAQHSVELIVPAFIKSQRVA